MPALDNCHHQVINALKKDGWTIVPHPHVLYTPLRQFYIDIEARRGFAPVEQIAIFEAKCFSLKCSQPDQLYGAIGQDLVYRDLLKVEKLEDVLYLAVPLHAFNGIFRETGMNVIVETRMKLIVFDLAKEEIVRWIY